jgi:hypothetical protein
VSDTYTALGSSIARDGTERDVGSKAFDHICNDSHLAFLQCVVVVIIDVVIVVTAEESYQFGPVFHETLHSRMLETTISIPELRAILDLTVRRVAVTGA